MATLSACVVVKNGKASILRCLDALVPMADEIVVVDTGSTDGTVELLEDWVSRHSKVKCVVEKVGGKFHDADGIFDFGAAKSYAMSIAHGDYVMWADVNDILIDGARGRSIVNSIWAKYPNACITMLTKVSPKFAFPRVRIMRRDGARMEGIIHEIMTTSDKTAPRVHTKITFENYKASRDIGRNLKALAKAWNIEHTQRTAFYMANTHKDLGELAHALDWYSVVIDMFPEDRTDERFYAMQSICDMACATHSELDDLGTRSLQMIEENPDRPEGYYYRARYDYEINDYIYAAKCLEKILSMDLRKDNGYLFKNSKIYNRDEIVNLLNLVNVRIQESNAAQLQYADPLQPDEIMDTGYGGVYGGYDGGY